MVAIDLMAVHADDEVLIVDRLHRIDVLGTDAVLRRAVERCLFVVLGSQGQRDEQRHDAGRKLESERQSASHGDTSDDRVTAPL